MRKISKWKRRAVKIRIQKAANSTRIFGLAIKLPQTIVPHKKKSKTKTKSTFGSKRGLFVFFFF